MERVHKIVAILAADGGIEREYKTISENGVVRDVPIDPEERLALYQAAHAVSAAHIASAQAARAEEAAARATVESDLAAAQVRISELERARVEEAVV